MDLWDEQLQLDCEHTRITVEPGVTEDAECIGYCDNCGERLDMGFSWNDHKLEVDFNQWAAEQVRRSRTSAAG